MCVKQKKLNRSPKVVALFSATNFSSFIIELLQMHDTIQIKRKYAVIHYDIAERSHLMIYKCTKLLVPNLVAFCLFHGKHSFGKVINEVWYQACNLMRFVQQTHIYILHQTHDYHLSHDASEQMIVENSNVFLFCGINCTKSGTKN